MSLATLLSVGSTLLKFAPTVIEAVVGMFKGISAIRKDVNPDTVIRADVAARINHMNVIVSTIASASGNQINIPLVLVPADFPAWQTVVGRYLNDWHNQVVIPTFVDPMCRLLLRLPPSRPGTKHSVSTIIGYNDADLRRKIGTLPEIERERFTADYNSVVSFLNSYSSVFTSWKGKGEEDLQEMSEVNETDYANATSWLSKESYLEMINQAKQGFLSSLPNQAISRTGSVYAWDPNNWVQGATDSTFIFTEALTVQNSRHSGLAPDAPYVDFAYSAIRLQDGSVNNGACVDGNTSFSYGDITANKNRLIVRHDGAVTVAANGAHLLKRIEPGDVLRTLGENNLLGGLSWRPTYMVFLKKYEPSDDLTPVEYLTPRTLPKAAVYDWFVTNQVKFNAHHDIELQVYYRFVLTATADVSSFVSVNQKQWPWKYKGALNAKYTQATLKSEVSHFVDLEVPDLSGITEAQKDWFIRFEVLLITSMVDKVTTPADFVAVATSPGWFVVNIVQDSGRYFYIDFEASGVAAVPTSAPVTAENVTYVEALSPTVTRTMPEDATFFDYMGKLLYSTGEDPNFTVYSLWLRRLGENGIAINRAWRALYDVGLRLGVDISAKYDFIDNPELLSDSQRWLLSTGPFVSIDTTGQPIPLSREKILKALQYFWSDLLTLEYFISQSSVTNVVATEVLGDLD